ncbi:MAG: hypothetical protein JWR72_476 [Flavisolibacter sp.]|nr:hypothetical protein [Flavisolibacter sp.]
MNSVVKDIEITIDGRTETIKAERLSDAIYYCLESPVFSGVELYGCELEVVESGEGLKFVKILKASNYTTFVYAWSREFLDSGKGKKIKATIVETGGDWEQVMGGVFFIHLPKEKDHLLHGILNAE